jgi:AcrR family transcriptional regulator
VVGVRRKGSDTKAEIREVALDLFTSQGYDATSLREIAERLGITKAALYYHYDSKEAIIRGVFEQRIADFDTLIEWASAQPRTPELPAEIFRRWYDLNTEAGLRLIRFAVANHHAMRDHAPDKDGAMKRIQRIVTLIGGPDVTMPDQMRITMALLSINIAVMAGQGLGADDDAIIAAAKEATASLLRDLLPAYAPH